MPKSTLEIADKFLKEFLSHNPEGIFQVFPEGRKLIFDTDERVKSGELTEEQAREVVEPAFGEARLKWIRKAADDLGHWIFEEEAGRDLDATIRGINKGNKKGNKKAALALAGAMVPMPGSPGHEALEKIFGRYEGDKVFLSKLQSKLRETSRRKKSKSRRLRGKDEEYKKRRGGVCTAPRQLSLEVFFWIKFNEPWLRRDDVDTWDSYEAWLKYSEDRWELADQLTIEAFRKMLNRSPFGIKKAPGRPRKGKESMIYRNLRYFAQRLSDEKN